ncbi:MAG TPA: hypothetical protein VJV04_01730, partial [Nitrospiraceae bacterium]|nr:hypothetical protein [Nitrospiraceae bacterium]
VAAAWGGLLMLLLRTIGLRRFDALVFTLLGLMSASAMFWLLVPETYGLGSISILVALLVAARPLPNKPSLFGYIAVNVLTLGITVTNWSAGLLTTIAHHPFTRAVKISIVAFCLVALASVIARSFFFPTMSDFIGLNPRAVAGDTRYIAPSEDNRLTHILLAFFSHSVLMPEIQSVHAENWRINSAWPQMSIQRSSPASATWWGKMALGLWLIVLTAGLWGLSRRGKEYAGFRIVLGLTLLSQLVLHLVYGEETFLYSLHYLPLLITLAALSVLTPLRSVVLLAMLPLLIGTGVNNLTQLQMALAFFQTHAPPRHQFELEMHRRPSDPWPRGAGHVVLAMPGSREAEKGYVEPGGSFSPGPATFGVSIWGIHDDGTVTTSDSFQLSAITQHVEPGPMNGQSPAIATTTSLYEARWSAEGIGRWTLKLRRGGAAKVKIAVVIRSVGPAGGPVRSLRKVPNGVMVNDQWLISVVPKAADTTFGDERAPGWMVETQSDEQWQNQAGWGYARISIEAPSTLITIVDTQHLKFASAIQAFAHSPLDLDVPDMTYQASLYAQVVHLLMGLVGMESRPGDPFAYPLPSMVDTAYAAVALARAGYQDVAQTISVSLMEQDFYGPWGPQADMPGLAIWALTSVAAMGHDTAYERHMWPHVMRKAEFIVAMLETKNTLRAAVPELLRSKAEQLPWLSTICVPGKDGLIRGRVERTWPSAYVNATAYLGLQEAAVFANRLGHEQDARRWRDRAEALQRAWKAAFPLYGGDMFYLNALWPTSIGESSQAVVQQELARRWERTHDKGGPFSEFPSWPDAAVAESHQWLYLRDYTRAWSTLTYFFRHQTSPGLYIWGRPVDPETSMDRWDTVRGGHPLVALPDYSMAAQILLLQLDMLAMRRVESTGTVIIVGAGVPESWLAAPFHVHGLVFPEGRLSWSWDGNHVSIGFTGQPVVTFQLGGAFPASTLIKHS